MKILVVGGAGYLGSVLVPFLLADGHKVEAWDVGLFGDGGLPLDNGSLKFVRDNVAYHPEAFADKDAVIFLASLSNNDMCLQYPHIAAMMNDVAFGRSLTAAKEHGVKRFIYASSVAAYGSSTSTMNEDAPLKPTTPYGESKARCEEILMAAQEPGFCCIATRAATICGSAFRPRFDITVNKMIHDGVRLGKITVRGGDQIRAHVHIRDVVDFYRELLKAPNEKVCGEAFNIVWSNYTVADTASMASAITGAPVEKLPYNDDRSYAVTGRKATQTLGWQPRYPLTYAMDDLASKLKAGLWPDASTNPIYLNHISQ